MKRREFIRVKSVKGTVKMTWTPKVRRFWRCTSFFTAPFLYWQEVCSLFCSRSASADKNVPWMLWFCGEKKPSFLSLFRIKKTVHFMCTVFWWRRWDSNSLPLQCECSALPDELRPQALIKYSRFFVVCQYRRKINLKMKRKFSWRCIRRLIFGAIYEFGLFPISVLTV